MHITTLTNDTKPQMPLPSVNSLKAIRGGGLLIGFRGLPATYAQKIQAVELPTRC